MESFSTNFTIRLDSVLSYFMGRQLKFKQLLSTDLARRLVVLWVLLVLVLEEGGCQKLFSTNFTCDSFLFY